MEIYLFFLCEKNVDTHLYYLYMILTIRGMDISGEFANIFHWDIFIDKNMFP